MSDIEEAAEKIEEAGKVAAGGLLGIIPGILGLSLTLKGIEYMTKEEESKE